MKSTRTHRVRVHVRSRVDEHVRVGEEMNFEPVLGWAAVTHHPPRSSVFFDHFPSLSSPPSGAWRVSAPLCLVAVVRRAGVFLVVLARAVRCATSACRSIVRCFAFTSFLVVAIAPRLHRAAAMEGCAGSCTDDRWSLLVVLRIVTHTSSSLSFSFFFSCCAISLRLLSRHPPRGRQVLLITRVFRFVASCRIAFVSRGKP